MFGSPPPRSGLVSANRRPSSLRLLDKQPAGCGRSHPLARRHALLLGRVVEVSNRLPGDYSHELDTSPCPASRERAMLLCQARLLDL